MSGFIEVARTGLTAVLLHPLRSLVTTGCVVAVFFPYLTCLALSQGIGEDAEASVRFGADLYVTGDEFGRNVPIPLAAADEIRRIEGVTEVVPRIVGRIVLGKDRENAILVGVSLDRAPPGVTCIRGSLPARGAMNKLVVGTELARRLKLDVGSFIPPFYANDKGERVSEVVGVFRSDVSLWQARLVLTSFDTAAEVFDQEGLATDLLVSCRPGYEESIRLAIHRTISLPRSGQGRVRPRVTARQDLGALLPQGLLHREGIFNLHFVLAFVIGMLAVLVTSGLGLSERRREIGILKATGWQTDEVLLRGLVESLVLSLAGASVSVLLAFTWLKGFNGYWVAGLFIEDAGAAPAFDVPFRLAPIPALLTFVLSGVVVLSGTLFSSWRAAKVAPVEAMR
jgi:ABC-type lipoprotein release transport system permease subunit